MSEFNSLKYRATYNNLQADEIASNFSELFSFKKPHMNVLENFSKSLETAYKGISISQPFSPSN